VYANRDRLIVGSSPTTAAAPSSAMSIAKSTSRAAWSVVTAGTVAITAKTAVTTHVSTAAPVRSMGSSVTTTAAPRARAREP
jgi:hypothetical protein